MTSPLVSPASLKAEHPLCEFRRQWNASNKREKEEFDYSEFRAGTLGLLDMLGNAGNCFDVQNPSRRVACSCMANLVLTEEETEATIDYLINFFKLRYEEQRSLILEWKRYSKTFRSFNNDEALSSHQTYLLPGSSTHRVCKNAIAKLVGKERHAWSSIGKPGKAKHGLAEQKGNNSLSEEWEEKLNEYFFSLSKLGAPRATKIVTGLSVDKGTVTTELKHQDVDLIELPACHTKRSLYQSFLLENDLEVSFDNKSRMSSKEKIPLSWPAFCSFWTKNYPKVVISKPAEDLCDDCVVFANKHKYIQSRRRRKPSSPDDEDSDDDPSPPPPTRDEEEALRDEEEDLVVAAAKHVEMAKAQRLFFVSKKEEAKQHAADNKPRTQRTYCFVADFAQNMYVPNFAQEQPGATYYYSPLNVYPFGVVDASTDPTLLTAFIFNEGKFMLLLP
jgi:hypothetical protein